LQAPPNKGQNDSFRDSKPAEMCSKNDATHRSYSSFPIVPDVVKM
jgi:hypothetical protein